MSYQAWHRQSQSCQCCLQLAFLRVPPARYAVLPMESGFGTASVEMCSYFISASDSTGVRGLLHNSNIRLFTARRINLSAACGDGAFGPPTACDGSKNLYGIARPVSCSRASATLDYNTASSDCIQLQNYSAEACCPKLCSSPLWQPSLARTEIITASCQLRARTKRYGIIPCPEMAALRYAHQRDSELELTNRPTRSFLAYLPLAVCHTIHVSLRMM